MEKQMILSKQEVLDVFENAFDTEGQIAALRREIADSFKSYAESNEIEPKVMKQAYASYKAFKNGKVTSSDEDYFTLISIIEDYFHKGDKDGNVSA
jgi:hypothetical protein